MVDEGWPKFDDPDEGEELRVHRAGDLLLASGSLVVCDPFVRMNEEPLARRVSRGRHPVELLTLRSKGDTRVALARVRFSSSPPSRWSIAVWPGQDERTLGPGQIFGYGVDAGTGCFADPGALEAFGRLNDPIAELEDMGHTWSVGTFERDAASVVAFSSGYGDGVYASYWGLDDADEVVALVTDFGVLDVHWPAAGTDPAFRKAYALEKLDELLELAPKIGRGSEAFSRAYELAADIRSLRSELGDRSDRLLAAIVEHAGNDAALSCLTGAIDWSDESVQPALTEALEGAGYEAGWAVLEDIADRLRWEALLPAFAAWVHEGASRSSPRWATALSIASRARQGHAQFFAPAAAFIEKDWQSEVRARTNTREAYVRARNVLGMQFIQPSLRLLAQAPSLPTSTVDGLARLLAEGDTPWLREAMRLLAAHGAARVRPFLAADDVAARVLAAEVILRERPDDTEALATVRAVIDDLGSSSDEVRASAVHALPDKEERKRAFLAWAIAGNRIGLVQYGYVARGEEAMDGLRRVIRECNEPSVVEDATRRLASHEKSRAR